MTLTNALEWKPKELNWLIPGLLCNSITLLSGEAKMGKTLFAGNLARALINQTEILGKQPRQGEYRIAWMGFDLEWRQEFVNNFEDIRSNVWFADSTLYKSLDKWQEIAKSCYIHNVNFLVVDYLCGLAPGVDLNYSHFVDDAFYPLQEFFNLTGIPILLLHHANKTGSGRAANSVLIEAKARLICRISGQQNKKAKTIEFIGNQIETHKLSVVIKPEGVEFSEVKSRKKEKSDSGEVGKLLSLAKTFDKECPLEGRKSAVKAGRWLFERGEVNSAGYGRNRINAMLTTGLLKRDGIKGVIIAGPKLLY
jgi:hypothetical protein